MKEIEVYSQKYDIHGKVTKIGGMSTKLIFSYEGQYYEMGITNCVLNDTYENYCEKLMDSDIEMMRVFYASTAVLINGSDEIFSKVSENYL